MFRLSLLAPIILMACSAPIPSSTMSSDPLSHLAPHDVSILMPYLERPELLELSPLLSQQTQPGEPGFLPPGVYEYSRQRIDKTPPASDAEVVEDLSDFRVASIRIDPCANIILSQGKKELCAAQFRIVWQDVSMMYGRLRGLDANIHAVYALTQDELATIVTELKSLHQASGLSYGQEPLGPHPVIAKEGNGPFYQGILRMLALYAIPSKLSFFASLGEANINEWKMTAFQLVDGQIQKNPLPNFKPNRDGSPVLQVGMMGGQGFLNGPDQEPTTNPSIFESLETAPLDNILKIENPLSHDISNADCSACHMARIEREGVVDTANFNGQAIPPDVSSVSGSYPDRRWNRERRADFSNEPLSLQMFSFFMEEYAVSQRTINETAEVMNWLEKNLP